MTAGCRGWLLPGLHLKETLLRVVGLRVVQHGLLELILWMMIEKAIKKIPSSNTSSSSKRSLSMRLREKGLLMHWSYWTPLRGSCRFPALVGTLRGRLPLILTKLPLPQILLLLRDSCSSIVD
jgi:hypothetical protein